MVNIEKSNYKTISLLENLAEEAKYITKENIKIENWNHEYEAMNIYINGQYFKSRLAKKTPKKAGYFVAMWHKNEDNKNIPFQYEDFPEKLIINIIDDRKKGQFIIPKDVAWIRYHLRVHLASILLDRDLPLLRWTRWTPT